MPKKTPAYFWLGGMEATHDARYRIPARKVAPRVLEVYACKKWWTMHLAGYSGLSGKITPRECRELIKQSDTLDCPA